MNILVTAGATAVPIDRVRAITNIFKGRTGTEIAIRFAVKPAKLGDWPEMSPHRITLLTSNPRLAEDLKSEVQTPWDPDARTGPPENLEIRSYRTFDELAALMEREITMGTYDLVIHSAAVSDYRVAGIELQQPDGSWASAEASGKLSSAAPGMRLTLAPTPKLLDQIRKPWGFTGKLVQFKLEVGISDEELRTRARAALERSKGDLCVANCLAWARKRAILVGADGSIEHIARAALPAALVRRFA